MERQAGMAFLWAGLDGSATLQRQARPYSIFVHSATRCAPQPFASLSSTTDKAGAILSQIIGSAMGEVQDYGELMIQTRFGEEVRVSCEGSRTGTGGWGVGKGVGKRKCL